MRKFYGLMLAGVVGLCVVGCSTTIPAKLEVRDTTGGRTYTTYQPWGKITKGVGYSFTDLESGKQITLTNYELKTLESEKTVPVESPEAKQFKNDKARVGAK